MGLNAGERNSIIKLNEKTKKFRRLQRGFNTKPNSFINPSSNVNLKNRLPGVSLPSSCRVHILLGPFLV